MFITLLYVSAFMFFIAGRKIKHSSLLGIIVILFASLPFSYRTLFEGYRIFKLFGSVIPGISDCDKNLLSFVFAVFVSVVFALVFFLLAWGWSRNLFRDEMKSRKTAGRIFVAASVIPGIGAIFLSAWKQLLPKRSIGFILMFTDNLGSEYLFLRPIRRIADQERFEMIRTANTVYVVLLFVFCLVCITLFCRRAFGFKDLQISSKDVLSAFSSAVVTVALGSVLTFLTLAQRGYLYWSANYRLASFMKAFYYSIIFGSYNENTREFSSPGQYVFCMVVLGFLAVSVVLLLISVAHMAVRKLVRQYLFTFVFSLALLLTSSGCICKMIFELVKFKSIGS